HRFARGIYPEERPGPGDERILFDDALIDLHAETGSAGKDEIALLDGERLAQDFVRERKGIHARPAGFRVARVLQPLDDVSGPADSQMRGGKDFQRGAPTVKGE